MLRITPTLRVVSCFWNMEHTKGSLEAGRSLVGLGFTLDCWWEGAIGTRNGDIYSVPYTRRLRRCNDLSIAKRHPVLGTNNPCSLVGYQQPRAHSENVLYYTCSLVRSSRNTPNSRKLAVYVV